MRKRIPITPVVLTGLLASGPLPGYPDKSALETELENLTRRGLSYEIFAEAGKVQAVNSATGELYSWNLDPLLTPRQPLHGGLPTLTVDLSSIDTSLYSWMYHYHSTIPVSGNEGFAMLSRDLNQNDLAEVYGLYLDSSGFGTRICEITESNQWETIYTYPIRIGVVDNIGDIDLNGLEEVYASNGDTVYALEQEQNYGLPISNKFRFRRYHLSAFGIPMELADMTEDGRLELVYRGSEPDTIHTAITKTYVARYDTNVNNFIPIWGERLPPGCLDLSCASNLSSGDFDADGKKDIVTSAFGGSAYVVEYVGGDTFSVTWSDSLSVAGRATSGDVDGNGTEEFFVGGNQAEGDGNVHMRIFAYERVGDNQYEPFFAFDIYPVGYFFVDLYQTVDIDNDGQEELLLAFGGGNMIIKGEGSHQYSLFYYTPVASSDGLSAGDVNRDGVRELLVGQFLSGEPAVRQTKVYSLDTSLVSVSGDMSGVTRDFRLRQNYPNPFNQETVFRYELTSAAYVRLIIYDVIGREITTLVNKAHYAGEYSVVWDGNQKEGGKAASGVYLVRFLTGNRSQTKKILLLR